MRVVALNVGSSSLKAAVRDRPSAAPLGAAVVDRLDSAHPQLDISGRPEAVALDPGPAAAVRAIRDALASHREPDVIAHRIVHGGPDRFRTTVIDAPVLRDLERAVPLAPLHLPAALNVIALSRTVWPHATQVACFDTTFFADLPAAAKRLPVPEELAQLGIRRYGFHGLAIESVLLDAPDLADAVIAHLGSGCSVTSIGPDRTPRHTSMSFTPTGGMMSATRTGDIDPQIALYLIRECGYTASQLHDLFDQHSGLAGLAGGRHDVRDLAAATDAYAAAALDLFVRSAAMTIAATATTLETWRSLVFSGGVGEHDGALRGRVCDRLRLDGVDVRLAHVDEERVMDTYTRSLLEPA